MKAGSKMSTCRRSLTLPWRYIFIVCVFFVTLVGHASAQTAIPTERNYRDAILGKRVLTLPDQNADDRVDVADLVRFLHSKLANAVVTYVGVMDFDSSSEKEPNRTILLASQKIELVLPGENSTTPTQVKLKATDSPFLSGDCTMIATVSADGVPTFPAPSCTGSFNLDDVRNPFHKPLPWELTISSTKLNGTTLEARFTMIYKDLDTRLPLEFAGSLRMSKQISDRSLLLENAGDMDRLVAEYGL